MNTYQITQQGNPFTDYSLSIEAPINASQSVPQEAGSEHLAGSPEFLAQMQIAADNLENYYKTINQYTTQDESRNATFTYEAIPNSPNYTLISNWTVENAVMTLSAQTNTDLVDTALEAHLQSVTDAVVADFKAMIFMTDL
jgi:hypothetical protein